MPVLQIDVFWCIFALNSLSERTFAEGMKMFYIHLKFWQNSKRPAPFCFKSVLIETQCWLQIILTPNVANDTSRDNSSIYFDCSNTSLSGRRKIVLQSVCFETSRGAVFALVQGILFNCINGNKHTSYVWLCWRFFNFWISKSIINKTIVSNIKLMEVVWQVEILFVVNIFKALDDNITGKEAIFKRKQLIQHCIICRNFA